MTMAETPFFETGKPRVSEPDVQAGSNLDYALKYARLGWHVFPIYEMHNGVCSCLEKENCTNPGKHPRTSHGLKNATTSEKQIKAWWTANPRANIAVRTGRESGIFVVDIDKKSDGHASWDRFKSATILPETVEAISGGAGIHLYYIYDENLQGRIKSRQGVLKGVDVRGDNGYILVEPSNHFHGGAYIWEGSSDPTEGVALAEPPASIVDLVTTSKQAQAPQDHTTKLPSEEIAKIRSAMNFIHDVDDRDTWLMAGMALHSTNAQNGFALWSEWSQQSDKYDARDQRRVWGSFGKQGGRLSISLDNFEYTEQDGVTLGTLFHYAMQSGWSETISEPAKQPADIAPYVAPDTRKHADLQMPPGRLGELVEWGLQNAHRPQPHLTVNAVLAGVSAVMGRRYRTSAGNWSSLYFLNVAKSAAGKEHGKEVAEAICDAAGLQNRISGSGYTSSGAVFSQLINEPAHLAVIDEMGKALGSAQARGNQHKLDAMTTLMEAWGRCDGIMRPQSYSTMTLSQKASDERGNGAVYSPAITLLGMSTPETFYKSLSGAWIEDGFLARLLVVESPIGRQPGKFTSRSPMPNHLKDWLFTIGNPPVSGNIPRADTSDLSPTPVSVGIARPAMTLFNNFELESIRTMDGLDAEGIAALAGRDVEKAMRLALIISAGEIEIAADHAAWAIDYVRVSSRQTIASVREHMHEGEFSELQAHLLQVIRDGGRKGRTERELNMYSRKYKNLKPKEKSEAMSSLKSNGQIAFVKTEGRRISVWVAIADDEKPEPKSTADIPQTVLSAVQT